MISKITIARAIQYHPAAPCPFCGEASPSASLPGVDLYRPFRDAAPAGMLAPKVPCCPPCQRRYLRWDRCSLAMPVWLGYLSSVIHRATYQSQFQAWLRQYAIIRERRTEVKSDDPVPYQRAWWIHLLFFILYVAWKRNLNLTVMPRTDMLTIGILMLLAEGISLLLWQLGRARNTVQWEVVSERVK